MKILVLGATGRTGYLFTRKALEGGHTVTAYVRNPDKAHTLLGAHQNLTITPGTLDDAERLAAASAGQDVMVSTLGPVSYTHLDVYKRQADEGGGTNACDVVSNIHATHSNERSLGYRLPRR